MEKAVLESFPKPHGASEVCRGSPCQRLFVPPRVMAVTCCHVMLCSLSLSRLFNVGASLWAKRLGNPNLEDLSSAATYFFSHESLLIQNILKEVVISVGQAGCSLLDFFFFFKYLGLNDFREYTRKWLFHECLCKWSNLTWMSPSLSTEASFAEADLPLRSLVWNNEGRITPYISHAF